MRTLFFPLCLIVVVAAGAAAQTQNSAMTAGTPVPGAVGTTGNVPVADANDYELGAGDKIRVEVYKEPQLSQSLQVRPDGKITMPLIGDMVAAGYTPTQLRDRIGTALKDYLNNPVVSVIVTDAVASTVTIIGEVNKQGPIPLTGPTTVVQALAMAGGFRDFAKTSDVRIMRHGPRGDQVLHFNYDDAIKGKAKMIYLQRGDTIIVR